METKELLPVDISDTIYRAITRTSWIDNNNNIVLGAAFHLREDEMYVSANRLGGRVEEVILSRYRKKFRRVKGAARLNVYDCFEVGVEVFGNLKKSDRYYCGIFYPDEPDVRLSMADDLADIATFVKISYEITVNI